MHHGIVFCNGKLLQNSIFVYSYAVNHIQTAEVADL